MVKLISQKCSGTEEVITAWTRNPSCVSCARGFKSHPLRHKKPVIKSISGFFFFSSFIKSNSTKIIEISPLPASLLYLTNDFIPAILYQVRIYKIKYYMETQPMPAKKHIELIDILKGVAILSVLLCHSIIVYPINLEAIPWCLSIKLFVDAYQMPMFFIISGFLCTYHEKHYGQYLLSRTKRILVPYVVFSTIATVCKIAGSSIVNRQVDLKSAVFQLFFQGYSSGTYWFLYTLFVLSALAPLFLKLIQKSSLFGILLIGIFVAISAAFDITSICSLNNVIYNATYYLIGMMLKSFDFQKVKQKNRLLCLTLGSVLLFALSFGVLRHYAPGVYDCIGKYISALTACTCIAGFFTLVKVPSAIRKPLIFSGKYSLQIYLLNGFLMTGSRWLFVSKLGITNPILVILLIFTFCYLISIVVSKIMDSNNLFRFLCGLKVRKKAPLKGAK